MKISDFVFVGIKGSVVALNRATGQQEWTADLKGSDFVNVAVQNDKVIASCYGEIFCLDPFTGNALWHNPLKGFGIGLATIAMASSLETDNTAVLSEKRRRDQESASSASSASV